MSRVFIGTPEIAIDEDELKNALELWARGRFMKPNEQAKTFTVSNIKHCRSSSRFALRFDIEED